MKIWREPGDDYPSQLPLHHLGVTAPTNTLAHVDCIIHKQILNNKKMKKAYMLDFEYMNI